MGTTVISADCGTERIGRIPLRNLWLLLLYASDLARFLGRFDAAVEKAADLPSLIARLLAYVVERRLRRNLSRSYVRQERILTRVRGRIDVMRTHSRDLLSRGRVACRFYELTINTPRNRFVRSALHALSGRVVLDSNLADRCRMLVGDLARLGVDGIGPSREELAADQIGRHEAEDRLMVTLAHIVFDLVLPTEDWGDHALTRIQRDHILVRKIFQKAVGNFFATELDRASGWRVQRGKCLYWQLSDASAGIESLLPNMQTDIILENAGEGRRLIIDTKFAAIFAPTAYREAAFKSDEIRQMYAYLRSQEHNDDLLSKNAEGILLHPAIDADVDENVTIQGHKFRFVTVNLSRPSGEILSRLRSLPHQHCFSRPLPGSMS
jgi:5-methylcytosine-specific restriction enzyme subunit McrC